MAIFNNQSKIDELTAKSEREKKLRKEAERLLEEKSLESYYAKQELEKLNIQLEEKNDILQKTMEKLMITQEELEKVNFDLLASIQYSKRIQDAIIPTQDFLNSIFPSAYVIYQPKHLVSGDFYWFKKFENQVMIIVADCTGHGVPGAFMSLLGISSIKNVVNQATDLDPGHLLNQIDKEIMSVFKSEMDSNTQQVFNKKEVVNDGMDVSAITINLDSYEMKHSSAFRPIYLIQEGELVEMKGMRQPIGHSLFPKEEFTSSTHQLTDGDIVYLFTDGFSDQFGGEKNRKFSSKRFKKLLTAGLASTSFISQKEYIIKNFEDWMGNNEQTDDMTLLGLQL